MTADAVFRRLREIDEALARVSFGDVSAVETVLPERADLLARAAALACTEEHYTALRRSLHVTASATRQICLARNLIAQQIAQLAQQQRWRDSIAGQLPEPSSNWSLQA